MKLTSWIICLLLTQPISTALAMSNADIVKTINQAKIIVHHRIHQVNRQYDFTWSSLNGPTIGKSVHTVQMKNNPAILFAYRPYVFSPLYRSIDSGQSWQRLQLPHHISIRDMYSIDANHLIIGSREGIYLSSDQGNTWALAEHMDQDIDNLFVSHPYLMLAVANNGSPYNNVYRSTDLGHTWTPARLGLNGDKGMWGIGGRDNILFIGANGLNISSNGGLMWAQPSQKWQETYADSIAVNSKFDVFVIGGGFYKTDSTGHTWEEINKGFPGYSEKIQVDEKDRLYLISHDVDNNQMQLSRSSDNGKTWNILYASEFISDANVLESGKILLSTERGLFQSDDSQEHFTPLTTNFSISKTAHVLVMNDKHYFAIDGEYGSTGQNDTLYHSDDEGQSWKLSYHGRISGLELQKNRLIMAANFYDILTSDNLGQTWQTSYHFDNGYIKNLSIANGAILVTRDNGQYLSFDLKNWEQLTSDGSYNQAYFDGKNVYVYANSAIKMSADQGKTWITLLDNLNQYGAIITGYQSKVILVAFDSAGILKSTNQGKTWDLINQGLYDFHFNTLKVIDENHYIVATDQSVFFTKDGGAHWITEDNGLENENVLSLSVNNKLLLAGTDGAGVFKATIK